MSSMSQLREEIERLNNQLVMAASSQTVTDTELAMELAACQVENARLRAELLEAKREAHDTRVINEHAFKKFVAMEAEILELNRKLEPKKLIVVPKNW